MAAITVQAGRVAIQVCLLEPGVVFIMAFKTQCGDRHLHEHWSFTTMGQVAIKTGIFRRRMD